MKYQKELSQIPQCPPSNAVERKQESYRFSFDPLGEDSFIPQGVKDPSRVSRESEERIKCSLIGLSFYYSRDSAIENYQNIRVIKNIKKAKIGSHLAVGVLEEEDGLQTPISKSGHFDLHEYNGVVLHPKFKILSPL